MTQEDTQSYYERSRQLIADGKAVFLDDDPFRSDNFYTRSAVKQQLDNGLYVGGRALQQPTSLEDRIGTTKVWEKFNRYGVFEREAITDEIHNARGDIEAVITRDHDGFLVLNAKQLMFVDVDFTLELMYKAIGFREPLDELIGSIEDKVVRFAQDHHWAIRLYRTHSGLRLMVTHKAWESVDESFDVISVAVGSDPLFRERCHIQKCFRARLTPKAERCGVGYPSGAFPFCSPEDEVSFADWLKRYDTAASHFATCGLATDIGTGVIAPELVPLIKLHDDYTKATLLSNVTQVVEDYEFESAWRLA
jgi:hypothetical protein